MKKKIIISLLLVIAIVLISVTCGLHVTAYNNTSKTNTVFVIDENGKATVGVSYTGYKDITTHAQISVKIQKEGANTPVVNETIEASGVKYDGELERQLTEKGKYICTVVYTVYGSGGTPDVIEYSAERMCGKDASHATSVTAKVPTPAIPGDPIPMPFVDFGGYTFTFASCINATDGWADREVYAEENGTGVLDKAIIARNDIMFDNYNCFIEVVDIDSLVLTDDHMANKGAYDIVGGKHNINAKGNGQYIDFFDLDIDLANQWWDQRFIEDMSVDGQLYGIIGAFSISSFDAASVLFFNKTVKEQNEQLKDVDFYELISGNKWTVDKFFEIVKKAYTNTDSGEIRGFASSDEGIRGLYFGAGQSYVTKIDEIKSFSYKKAINSVYMHGLTDKAAAVTDKILDIFAHDSAYITSVDELRSDFTDGKVLFSSDLLKQASVYAEKREAGDKSFDFGILPYPKLSADRSDYSFCVDDRMIYLSVPKAYTDRAKIAEFLERYAYHSYHTVYRDYIELYENEYFTDKVSADTFDIIRCYRSFDQARHFGWADIDTDYVYAVRSGKNLITEYGIDTYREAIEKAGNSYKEYLGLNN